MLCEEPDGRERRLRGDQKRAFRQLARIPR